MQRFYTKFPKIAKIQVYRENYLYEVKQLLYRTHLGYF
ncbi:hypothetical protein H1P_150061 [Hyella patelloides LEGE 07179]|uniref:Uncharacterized protein n=1 Tax=Hyella patelloides LEGE 07179 TaxID=945734 RepID=A0A563VMB1_9CYAN|nr:hypothetical protein H1P_150061 [Hyella patelloides LEGE 07179]